MRCILLINQNNTASSLLWQPIPTGCQSIMNINVGQRIMAVGAVGVFGLMLVGALYFYGNWVQDGFRAASDDAERIAGAALKLRVDFLDARRLEKDFLLRRDRAPLTRHKEASKPIQSNLSSSPARPRSLGQPQPVR